MAADATERTLTDRAHATLRQAILSGALPPGQPLRPQHLQDRFGLGVTPLREALMRLSAEGLVDGAPQRGMRVAGISRAALADLTRTRCDIERLCLTRAIRNGGPEWEAGIVAAFHLLSRTALPGDAADTEAASRWEAHHRRFHEALVAACDSDWLLRFWQTLADHSERYRRIRLLHRAEQAAEVRDLQGEHAAIMQAVLRRDPDAACALMDAHLEATARAILAMMAAEA